jgi:hypothetical protein
MMQGIGCDSNGRHYPYELHASQAGLGIFSSRTKAEFWSLQKKEIPVVNLS